MLFQRIGHDLFTAFIAIHSFIFQRLVRHKFLRSDRQILYVNDRKEFDRIDNFNPSEATPEILRVLRMIGHQFEEIVITTNYESGLRFYCKIYVWFVIRVTRIGKSLWNLIDKFGFGEQHIN